MKFSITQKLVAAFLGLTLLVLIATLGLARWSFEQGFLDYVNALEQTRLGRVRTDLADEYLSAGSNWDSLTEQRFTALIFRSAPREPNSGPPPDGMQGPPGDAGDYPPPRGMGPQGPGAHGFPPTALYDAAGNLVAGVNFAVVNALTTRVPIVLDGKAIGELHSEPTRHLSSPLETEFSRQQLNTSWILGILSLVLAFAISVLLARGLLAPIRRLIGSVAQLSSGDYSHRMNENRSDELGQLTEDLDRLGSTLEANQSSRKRLLADVSHELRTPLTVLTGEIEALKDGIRVFDEVQLESLDQEVRRLRILVDDLYSLSISDVGGLRYQFAPVDLAQCLQHAVDGIYKRASAVGIEVTLQHAEDSAVKIALPVEADTQRIDQLLQNILANSLAYTDAPGRVNVAMSRIEAAVLVTIDDTAPGVKPSDCEQLFDPLFRREVSRSRRTGGAGLGLAICRNIVAAHGGSILASPSAMGGLSIRIEIPLAREVNT
jgi:two-component system sensor histidine kinase BaeS